MKPVKESGILRAPAENSISGIAVMAPEKINQNEELLYPNVRLPCCHIYHKYIIPAGAVTIHSIVSLLLQLGLYIYGIYNPSWSSNDTIECIVTAPAGIIYLWYI